MGGRDSGKVYNGGGGVYIVEAGESGWVCSGRVCGYKVGQMDSGIVGGYIVGKLVGI